MKVIRRCTIPDCKRWHHAKGLCAFHYEQKRLVEGKNKVMSELEGTPQIIHLNATSVADLIYILGEAARLLEAEGNSIWASRAGTYEEALRLGLLDVNTPSKESILEANR